MDIFLNPLKSHLLVQYAGVDDPVTVYLVGGQETKSTKLDGLLSLTFRPSLVPHRVTHSVVHIHANEFVPVCVDESSQIVVATPLGVASTMDPLILFSVQSKH